MPTFSYTALKASGERYKGKVEAKDKFDLYDQVRKEGGMIVSVKERSVGAWLFDMQKINAFLSTVKLEEKISFARNLAAMADAGLALSRALSVLERQTKNPKFKQVIQSVEADIGGGKPLHLALAAFPRVFSPLFVSMVRAGEESGGLGNALRIIAEQMQKSYTLQKKIKGALIYPAIVVGAMVVIGVLMLVYIVPTLESTFEELNAELPASTQAIISLSNFLTEHSLVALLLAILVVSAFVAGLRTKRGKRILDFTVLHMPLINGIAKEANAARTARTISSLLSAGVEMLSALEITEEVMQNSYYKEVIASARTDVRQGAPLSRAFAAAEHLYPVVVSEMVAVGEETGKLSLMLTDVANFYEEEVERRTKDLSTVIEPFLMIAIGIGVGFFAFSMIMPIYSLSESIK